jgi:hypothetical protein
VIVGFPALTAFFVKDIQQPRGVLLVELPRVVRELLVPKFIKRYFSQSAECPTLLPKNL